MDEDDPILQTIKDLEEFEDADAEDEDELNEEKSTSVTVEIGSLPDGHHLRKESHQEKGHSVVRISSGNNRPKN